MPKVEYTETTERIFSSSIETINTVGNVLFTENVAEFYQMRKFYKTNICDSVFNEITQKASFSTLKGTLEYQYVDDAMMSNGILTDMQHLYALCKKMMEVSDEEIEAYRKEREQMEKGMSDEDDTAGSTINDIMQLQKDIEEAMSKLKLE